MTSSRNNNCLYTNPHIEKEISKYQPHGWLDFSDRKLTDDDMQIVATQAIVKKECSNLNVRYNRITSIGTSILADALRDNTTLRILYLSYNQICDKGVQYLADALSNNRTLHELQLGHNEITDLGIQYLSKMLQTNQSLVHLGLPSNRIGDQGVQYLSDSLTHHNMHLEVLNLQENTSITDKSVDPLIEIIKHSRALQKLSVNNCNLSKKAVEQLQQIAHQKRSFILGAH